jgi:uncharacterized membrane protein
VIRLVLWVIAGLMLGLVVHLATLIAIPSLATRSAAARIEALVREGGFRPIPPPTPQASLLPGADPSLRLAICRYDLGAGPLRVRAGAPGGFFSVSFYTPDGLNFYSLTDRAAAEGGIELTVYTALQIADVRTREGPDTPEALRLEAPTPQGFVVFRALVPEASYAAAVERALADARCETAR